MLQSFSLKYFHQIVAAALRQHSANCGDKLTNQKAGKAPMTYESRELDTAR